MVGLNDKKMSHKVTLGCVTLHQLFSKRIEFKLALTILRTNLLAAAGCADHHRVVATARPRVTAAPPSPIAGSDLARGRQSVSAAAVPRSPDAVGARLTAVRDRGRFRRAESFTRGDPPRPRTR